MRRAFLLLSLTGALLAGQDLSKVHTVYLMPMARGLDQYLANRLTQERVFEVVTDPKSADAVFTDRIGPTFEDKLAELQGNPEPVSRSPKDEETPNPPSSANSPLPRVSAPASSFGSGKGTVFLIDPKTHHVLWSAYKPSKSSRSDDLNRTASDIVSRLKRDLKPKE
ncbi:MAG TPA: hypothetical protein VKT49_02175 [Bryobacteraceae bacterium]|nr:hypothetical protein [Bryobacteraceae bacterium]